MSGSNWIYRYEAGEPEAKQAFLLLHGTGGDENSLIPLIASISPESALLSPRGQVREGMANRFFHRLAEGVFDQEDLALRTELLANFVQKTRVDREFSEKPLYAVGFSNGANIAASMLLKRPEVLDGAVLIRAMVPFEPKVLPDLKGKRVLLLAGRYDPMVPKSNVLSLENIFKQAGATVELKWADVGHELAKSDLAAIANWVGSPL